MVDLALCESCLNRLTVLEPRTGRLRTLATPPPLGTDTGVRSFAESGGVLWALGDGGSRLVSAVSLDRGRTWRVLPVGRRPGARRLRLAGLRRRPGGVPAGQPGRPPGRRRRVLRAVADRRPHPPGCGVAAGHAADPAADGDRSARQQGCPARPGRRQRAVAARSERRHAGAPAPAARRAVGRSRPRGRRPRAAAARRRQPPGRPRPGAAPSSRTTAARPGWWSSSAADDGTWPGPRRLVPVGLGRRMGG